MLLAVYLGLASCCVALLFTDLWLFLPMILSMSRLVLVGPICINLEPISSFVMHPAAIRVLMQPLWRPRGRRATLEVAHLLVFGPPIRID